MAYATADDVQSRMLRDLSIDEKTVCEALLNDAAILIDSFAPYAEEDRKTVVSCRMVMRALGDGADTGVPIGATQGSQSALGYTQSWTISGGANGELYLTKIEKQLLGLSNRIGSRSPIENLVPEDCFGEMP